MKIVKYLLILLLLPLIGQAQIISGKSASKKINVSPASVAIVKDLPDLIITGEVFSDKNGNNMIDANEACSIDLNVENIGKGVAQDVKIVMSLKGNNIQGLNFSREFSMGNIYSETKKPVNLPVYGNLGLQDGMAEFLIEVKEGRGFDAYPLEMKIETREFASPKIVVADAVFATDDGGLVKLNYPVTLKVIVQNIGLGDASDVNIEFKLPNENCVVLGEVPNYALGDLKRGETKEMDFVFTANRRYIGNEIPVNILLSEKFRKYARDTVVTVGLQQELIARNAVVVGGIKTAPDEIKIASLSSDVDKNIPVNPGKYSFRYALIIGNEDYTRFQRNLNTESNVNYARTDARVFRDYAVQTLGIDPDNAYLLLDATAGEMQQKIDLITKLAAKTGSQAEIIFYYAGHGLPDEVSHEPYLIPVDVSGTNLNAAISLKTLYQKLSESNAARISVFLDACFSGAGRDASLLAARSVKVKPKAEIISGNMVVYSASSGEQSAMPYHNEQHGIFTYYLLKKIQETKGKISYGQLADYIISKVSLESLKLNQKEQDPQVNVSYMVQDKWKNWKLAE